MHVQQNWCLVFFRHTVANVDSRALNSGLHSQPAAPVCLYVRNHYTHPGSSRGRDNAAHSLFRRRTMQHIGPADHNIWASRMLLAALIAPGNATCWLALSHTLLTDALAQSCCQHLSVYLLDSWHALCGTHGWC